MIAFFLLAAGAAGVPAVAQDHQHHPGMAMPMPGPTPTPTRVPTHTPTASAPQMGGPAMPMPDRTMAHPAMSMAEHAMAGHTFTAPPAWRAASDAALARAPTGAAMAGMTMGTGGGWYTPGSGTARNPAGEGPMRGAMFNPEGGWSLMAHGYAWGVATEQSGPRGRDMAFVASMAMAMADRDVSDRLHLQLRAMGSLEPAMGPRGYPSLFATGEIADGRPLVDRQHPHDLFMELAARVDYRIGGDASLFVYGGPVAEPALGPSAFMHRGSARYLPLAPITHHWFDSTHITYGVVTAGYAAPRVQIEASAFRGREPDEHRWDIETPKLDSWSLRATWTPSPYWAVQASHGRLETPEVQHPGENERRTTASVQYARGGLAATLAWSAKDREPGRVLTAWLAEATWEITRRHAVFGRVENVLNDELFPDEADPRHDRAYRVTKAEAGYAYRVPIAGPVGVALGGTVMAFAKPDTLDVPYGRHPAGWTLFAKVAVGL